MKLKHPIILASVAGILTFAAIANTTTPNIGVSKTNLTTKNTELRAYKNSIDISEVNFDNETKKSYQN